MNQEKSKQIAPLVVLAQHGNKDAMRNIYIQYYKNIFFICKFLTGSASDAMSLTAEIFIKMYDSVDKLSDHMAFEQWFYSLAINLCKTHMPEDSEHRELVSDCMKELAEKALAAAKSKDKFTFEHSVMNLLGEMLSTLPNEAKIIFLYNSFAQVDAEKIAMLEKTDTENVCNNINAVNVLFEKQTEKIRESGVDVSPFINDMRTTLLHLASKTFVPDGVHEAVSENIGINVDPFAKKEQNEESRQKEKTVSEPKKDKSVKKNIFSKGDLILFFTVLVVAVLIFSGVKIYREAKNAETTVASREAETVEKPVLTWNGAAASSFDSGSGTEDDPYIISNGGQLAYLANLVNDGNSRYASCCYKLDCDIVLNDVSDYSDWNENAPENKWTPIGGNENGISFSGTFDGNGHTVSGMYVNTDKDYGGLFGKIENGSIKNLSVADSYVTAGSYCGGIVGSFSGNAALGSDIRYCSFSGTVSSSADNAGGIAGYIEASGSDNFISVYACCVFGEIYAQGENTGGIAGHVYANSGSVKISECFSAAEITAQGNNVGGIAGMLNVADGNSSVYNCYSSGLVSGGSDESTGAVTGVLKCADGDGVITVMYCTALEGTAPTLTGMVSTDSMAVKSVKTASHDEMKSADTFDMFDFDSVWEFSEDSDYAYPVLQGVNYSFCEKTTVL